MKPLVIHVVGIPQPQGSARAFVPRGWGRAVITSDNPKNKGWRQLVAEAAQTVIQATPEFRQFDGPVALEVAFELPRPKSLGKKTGVSHTKKPDLDKLLRSVNDALTGVVWRDDSQVVEVRSEKYYTDPGEAPGAVITVQSAESVWHATPEAAR